MLLGFFLVFFVGVFLGALGAGGAIFSIPILIYYFQIPNDDAIGISYLITGVSAMIASIRYFKELSWNKYTYFFIIPAVTITWIMRHTIIPHLETIIPSAELDKMLMIFLSLLISAAAMGKYKERTNRLKNHYYLTVVLAMLYGSLVGSVGSGGGFLLIPTFRLLMGMHMTQAVATSLSIIALTSLIGFEANEQFLYHISPSLIIFLCLCSICGIIVGFVIHDKCKRKHLELIFIISLVCTATTLLLYQLHDIYIPH